MGRRKKTGEIKVRVIEPKIKKIEEVQQDSELEQEVNEGGVQRSRFINSDGNPVEILGATHRIGAANIQETKQQERQQQQVTYTPPELEAKYVESARIPASPLIRNEEALSRRGVGQRLAGDDRRISPVAGVERSTEEYHVKDRRLEPEKKKRLL